MSDPLRDQLALAATTLANERDRQFAASLLRQHEAGRPLSPSQMHWAKTLIERSGQQMEARGFDKIDTDIFAETPLAGRPVRGPQQETPNPTDMLNSANETKLERIIERVTSTRVAQLGEQLVELNETRERNLAERQDAFNKNAAKSIAQATVKEALRQLDARVPRQTIITVKRADGSEHTQDGPTHPQFEELMRMLTLRKDDGYVPGIFLAGERGSGKTTGLRLAARALGMPWYANGAISFDSQMLGYMDGHGVYHRTPFRDAFEHGGLYTFDEADRSDPGAVLAVNPHLANGEAAFPDGMVKRHPDCIITATGNTWGLGATLEFSGANKLDEAFLSRFEIKLEWNVDLTFERKLVGNPDWHDYVQRARERIREAGMKYTIDSRAAIAGAKMIAQLGYSHDRAAQQTYLASMKPDQRKIVQGLGA